MTESEFTKCAARTRLIERSVNAARMYLVDGVTNYREVARRLKMQPQNVQNSVNRILREYKLQNGLPRHWETITVTVPMSVADEIQDIERRELRKAGLLID